MSLKHFHIFFIVVSILLSVGCGLWFFLSEEGAAVSLAMLWGVIFLVAAVGLTFYLVKVVKKLQDHRYDDTLG